MEAEARLNGDEARAKREKIRSIGHGSVIDDYIFEWAFQIPPPQPNKALIQLVSRLCSMLF